MGYEKEQYDLKTKKKIIKKHTSRSKALKNSIKAFISGGSICLVAEVGRLALIGAGIGEKDALLIVTLSVILIASVLTLLGVFDNLTRHTAAGTLVPISGFANAMVSEAMDSRSEGFVLGIGAKIFTVAGPVIVYGLSSGIVYGIIYYIFSII